MLALGLGDGLVHRVLASKKARVQIPRTHRKLVIPALERQKPETGRFLGLND